MENAVGLLGVCLDEHVLDATGNSAVALSLFADRSAIRALAAGETLNVRMRAIANLEAARPFLLLQWQLGEYQLEHYVDLTEPRQRELLRRVAQQPLLPLVISTTRGSWLHVYDWENPFRVEDEDAAGASGGHAQMSRECRHPSFRRHPV